MSIISLTPAGVVGMANNAYHSHASLSHSLCKWLEPETAPLQFWHRSWMNPERVIDSHPITGCMNTGTLMHMAMENMPMFMSTVQLLPRIKRTKKPGYIGAAAGGQLEALLTIRQKLLAMPLVQEAVEEGNPEVSFFSYHAGVPIRCRPDYCTPKLELHWKFTGQMERLGWVIDRFRYIEGIAWYRRVRRSLGLPDVRQVMVFCETKPPYEIRVIQPSTYFLDEADVYGHRAIQRFLHLRSAYGDGPWPDFSAKPQDIYHSSAGGPGHSVGMPYTYEKRISL